MVLTKSWIRFCCKDEDQQGDTQTKISKTSRIRAFDWEYRRPSQLWTIEKDRLLALVCPQIGVSSHSIEKRVTPIWWDYNCLEWWA